MTANDKQDNINISAEALPDGALAQVTGGNKDNPATYAVGDWVKLTFSMDGECLDNCITAVPQPGLYRITQFAYNSCMKAFTHCHTLPVTFSSHGIASPADPPSWAALAMEYYETHKGGAL